MVFQYYRLKGPVVQRLEPPAHNGVVVSSNLTGPTSRVIVDPFFVFPLCFYVTLRAAVAEGLSSFLDVCVGNMERVFFPIKRQNFL